MKRNRFPKGWSENKVKSVLSFYERQTEEEAVAEDEAAFQNNERTIIEVPRELLPVIREIIARHQATRK
ncbi:MAG TPA: hypothetical protein VJH03_05420 [Blastocatellia bacterium]|nr:hypothetical protein [Blastocatellia bacterium]